MRRHLISIIIPCYNQGEYLVDALGSVLFQSYENWECIIIDDGSTDETQDIAHQFCTDDKRFKYHKKNNGGLSSARNAGLRIAQGEYIQFLDSDDLLCQEKLKTSLYHFESKEQPDIIITSFFVLQGNDPKSFPPFYNLAQYNIEYKTIILDWDVLFSIPIHCAMFRSRLFLNLKFDEELTAKEDWLLWIKLFEVGSSYKFINDGLVKYRIHGYNMTSNAHHMYVNTLKAFQKIYENISDPSLKYLFFLKTNTFWTLRLNELVVENTIIKNRRINKLADKLISVKTHLNKIFTKSAI